MTDQLQDRVRQALHEARPPTPPSPLDWDSLQRGASRRRNARRVRAAVAVAAVAGTGAFLLGGPPLGVTRTPVITGPAAQADPVSELTYASVPWEPAGRLHVEPPWEGGRAFVTLQAGAWPLTSYRVGDRVCTSVVRTDLGSVGDTVCTRLEDTGLDRAAVAGSLAMVVLDEPVTSARFTTSGRDVEAVVYERLDAPGVRVAAAVVGDPREQVNVPKNLTFTGLDERGTVLVSGSAV